MSAATALSAGRARRRRLTLVLWLALLVVIGGGVVAGDHWVRLRQGLDAMRLALVDAREQQRQMRLRLLATEARLREQLDLLGRDAGDGAVRSAQLPRGLYEASGWAADADLPAAPAAPGVPSTPLARLAADLAAGGDVAPAVHGLRRLASSLRDGQGASAGQADTLSLELDALAAALAASTRIGWAELRVRLDRLAQAANRLPPPRAAQPVDPEAARGRSAATARRPVGGWSAPRSHNFRRAMRAQLEVADAALAMRDLALLRLSGASAERLVQAHYPADSAEAAAFLGRLHALRRDVKAMDREALIARIETLAQGLDVSAVDRRPTPAAPSPQR